MSVNVYLGSDAILSCNLIPISQNRQSIEIDVVGCCRTKTKKSRCDHVYENVELTDLDVMKIYLPIKWDSGGIPYENGAKYYADVDNRVTMVGEPGLCVDLAAPIYYYLPPTRPKIEKNEVWIGNRLAQTIVSRGYGTGFMRTVPEYRSLKITKSNLFIYNTETKTLISWERKESELAKL